MYSALMKHIDRLEKQELKQFILTQKELPRSDERTFGIGYGLLKLDYLLEAVEFLNNELGEDINKAKIWFATWRPDGLGGWRKDDDLVDVINDLKKQEGNNNDNGWGGCCLGIAGCCCLTKAVGIEALFNECLVCFSYCDDCACQCFECLEICFC